MASWYWETQGVPSLSYTVTLYTFGLVSTFSDSRQVSRVHSASVNSLHIVSPRGCITLAVLEEENRVDDEKDQLLICYHSFLFLSSVLYPLLTSSLLFAPFPHFPLFHSCKLKLFEFFSNLLSVVSIFIGN